MCFFKKILAAKIFLISNNPIKKVISLFGVKQFDISVYINIIMIIENCRVIAI